MEAVRTFIIRNKNWIFGIGIAGMAGFCVGITALAYPIGWFLAGILLLILSLLFTGNVQCGNKMWALSFSGYLLLGAAIYCFPANMAVIPFYILEAFCRRRTIRCGLLILFGNYVIGVQGVLLNSDILWPMRKLISWLNTENVFDHNLSFWSLVTGREQLRFGMIAVLVTCGILMLGGYLYVGQKIRKMDFLIWTTWTCLLFFPYGHAEDGMVLVIILLLSNFLIPCHQKIYRAALFLELVETLFMLGSAYGGYERLGYDFYQMAVGINVLMWLLFTYRGFENSWKKEKKPMAEK